MPFLLPINTAKALNTTNNNTHNGHFPGQSRKAAVGIFPFWILLQLRMIEVAVTTGAIGCAKLQSNRHHQQTNIQLVTGWMSFLSSNQQCQSTWDAKALNAI